MNVIIKKGLKLILTHIMSLALTLFFLMVFGWFVNKWGFYAFSILIMPFYIGLFYSEGWNWGRLEGKKYNDIKENPMRALLASIIPSIIPAVFVIAIMLGNNDVMFVIERLWYFPFIGFFKHTDVMVVSEVLAFASVIPIAVTAGYYVGTKNFSVLERIAFRKKRTNESIKK